LFAGKEKMLKGHYFKDDHDRTLRVVVSPNGHVSLGFIDKESGDVIYLQQDYAPPKESGIENCNELSRMQEMATVCPLHADNTKQSRRRGA
jgi:hypothetical protein